MTKNRRFILKSRPQGNPKASDFELLEEDLAVPPEGGFIVRNHFASLDPAIRGGSTMCRPICRQWNWVRR